MKTATMVDPDDYYRKAEEAIAKSLASGIPPFSAHSSEQLSTHSTAASTSFFDDEDSYLDRDDDLDPKSHQHAKVPFFNKTEQLKDHSSDEFNIRSGDADDVRRPRRSRSRSRQRNNRTKPKTKSKSMGSPPSLGQPPLSEKFAPGRRDSSGSRSVSRSRSASRSQSLTRSRSRSRSRSRNASRNTNSNTSPVDEKPKSSQPEKKPKSYRPKKPKSSRLEMPKMSYQQQQNLSKVPRQALHASNAAGIQAVLPPPDLSSSSVKSINLLVCTANLGNAAPDASSWDAWIPKDGRLVASTKFPVRMQAPSTPPAPQSSQSQPLMAKKPPPPSEKKKSTHDRGETGGEAKPSRRRLTTKESSSRPSQPKPKTKKPKRKDAEKDPYEAYLDSLKRKSSFDSYESTGDGSDVTKREGKDPATTAATVDSEPSRKKGTRPKGDRKKSSRRSDRNGSHKEPPRRTKSPAPVTPNSKSRRMLRSNSFSSSPDSPGLFESSTPKRRLRSRSNNSPRTESEGNSAPSTPKSRRVLRSKSVSSPPSPTETTPNPVTPKRRLIRSLSFTSSPSKHEGTATQSPKPRKAPGRSTSGGLTWARNNNSSGDTPGGNSSVPDVRRIVEAKELTTADWGEVEIRYPIRSNGSEASSSNPKQHQEEEQQLGCYDIIVIGMQEATFSTSDQNEKQKKALAAQNGSSSIHSGDFTESEYGSDIDFTDDDLSVSSASDDDDISHERPLTKNEHGDKGNGETKSSKKKRMLRRKSGTKGLKSGLMKKISKATSKTAKTVNTYAGGGKDHTSRQIPTSPLNQPEEAEESVAPSGSITPVASTDTDEEDYFVDLEGDTDGNNGKAKKWTDTDVLHHGLESNQLLGYTRALSYQFGEMRLLVYYKSGTGATDILQSLDVVSVKYQATGKAGLANKGGIVAEIAVNKTTRLSFLTAHLEAHEGIKHYKARNESFQNILMETGSSKYYDASQSSHFTFAMGDLNYRTRLADVAVGSDRHIQYCHNLVDRRDWRILNQFDELRKSLAKRTCLTGFQTAYCNFPPTFKVDRKQGYRYNEKRSPSYTDRILFKNADQLDAASKLMLYEPVEGFTSSDHKPIRSGFVVRLNRELRWKSTAELLVAADTNKSLDALDGILPETSKGNINADRETMHFFITNIECVINPDNYDQIRKQDKAELPNPKLLFVADPSEAVLTWEDPGKKRRFGIGSRSKSSNNFPNAPGENGKKNNLPSTSTCKDTMRPIWKEEYVYFALQTHDEHGRPIDFTGSQLHLSLVDNKSSGSVIGSHCLNLAHLVIQSREKAAKTLQRSESQHHHSHAMERDSKRFGMVRGTSHRRFGMERLAKPERQGSKGNRGKPKRNGAGGGALPQGGYPLVSKPSPALRSAAANASKFGKALEKESAQLPPAVRKAADALHRVESGANKLYDSILADLGGKVETALSPHKAKNSVEDFGFRSLRLQETLVEGGLVTGQLKCDVDVWWT